MRSVEVDIALFELESREHSLPQLVVHLVLVGNQHYHHLGARRDDLLVKSPQDTTGRCRELLKLGLFGADTDLYPAPLDGEKPSHFEAWRNERVRLPVDLHPTFVAIGLWLLAIGRSG